MLYYLPVMLTAASVVSVIAGFYIINLNSGSVMMNLLMYFYYSLELFTDCVSVMHMKKKNRQVK